MTQYLQGVEGSGYAQCRQLPGLPAVPHPSPRSLCTGKGPPWISFKAICQRVRGSVWGLSSRGSSGPITPWQQALREHRVSNWLSWPAVPTLSALQRLRKLVWQGELRCASLLQAALSLLPGGKHGNTEGLGRSSSEPQAPGQSPEVQGRPSARATTLKAKSPRALLWRADLTSPTRARKGPNHQTTQTLLSAQTMGPQQVAPLTPAGTPHSQPSPEARSLSLELSQEE